MDLPVIRGFAGLFRNPSLREFLRGFRGVLASMGVRSGLPVHEAEEMARGVVRAAEVRLVPASGNGLERDELRLWLFEMMRWRIADRLGQIGGRLGVGVGAGGGVESGLDRQQEEARRTMDLALYRMARKAPSRDFQVFELAVKQGWTIPRIARAFGLNLAVVWMIKRRLGRQLRRELASLEMCWG